MGIGGFTCVNDVTCRDLQRADGQWTRAKGFDTFCPVGPRVVSNLDWRGLELRCRVNGVERQHARAADMHFPIPLLVSYISGIMTLEPGDLIATGTPAGTAPLADGDVVEVEIPGVGDALESRAKRERQMITFSDRLRALPGYPLAEIPAIKRRLVEQGVDVIDLGAGDNDAPPPESRSRRWSAAVRTTALSKYGFQQGLPEFRQAAVALGGAAIRHPVRSGHRNAPAHRLEGGAGPSRVRGREPG